MADERLDKVAESLAKVEASISRMQHAFAMSRAFPHLIAILKEWGLSGDDLAHVLREMNTAQIIELVAAGPVRVTDLAASLSSLRAAQAAVARHVSG